MLVRGLWAFLIGLYGLYPKPLVYGSAIDVQVDEKKAYNHVADSVDLLCYVGLLCLTILTSWAFKTKRLRFLHESGLAVFYGLGVGLILKLTGTSRYLVYNTYERNKVFLEMINIYGHIFEKSCSPTVIALLALT